MTTDINPLRMLSVLITRPLVTCRSDQETITTVLVVCSVYVYYNVVHTTTDGSMILSYSISGSISKYTYIQYLLTFESTFVRKYELVLPYVYTKLEEFVQQRSCVRPKYESRAGCLFVYMGCPPLNPFFTVGAISSSTTVAKIKADSQKTSSVSPCTSVQLDIPRETRQKNPRYAGVDACRRLRNQPEEYLRYYSRFREARLGVNPSHRVSIKSARARSFQVYSLGETPEQMVRTYGREEYEFYVAFHVEKHAALSKQISSWRRDFRVIRGCEPGFQDIPEVMHILEDALLRIAFK
jgi:hypothetical protein